MPTPDEIAEAISAEMSSALAEGLRRATKETLAERDPDYDHGAWVVATHGKPNSSGYEIAIVRENNRHGRQSYGGFGEHKLLISQGGSGESLPVVIWDKLVKLAYETAEELNRDEQRKLYDHDNAGC